MNLLKIRYLILSILIYSSCGVPKESIRVSNPLEVQLSAIISPDSNAPVLYSAEFEVLKYQFSGLIAFRRMPEKKEIRIVFLTEVGIRVMEFSFNNGEIENTYSMEAIKKKSIVKFTGSFLQLLLTEPGCHSVYLNKTDTKSDYFCRLKKGNAIYEFNGINRTHVLLNKGRKKKTEAYYISSSFVPDEIFVNMKYHTQIQLKKVDNAFK
jgi:hypothetical protein